MHRITCDCLIAVEDLERPPWEVHVDRSISTRTEYRLIGLEDSIGIIFVEVACEGGCALADTVHASAGKEEHFDVRCDSSL